MSGKLISLIYFYLISAAALALIVVGIFNIVNFLINTTQYDKYPLRYQPFNCDIYTGKFGPNYDGPVPAIAPAPGATPSAEQIEQQTKRCEMQLDEERKKQRLDDLKSALTFTLIGTILFLIHFPMARKQSK